MKHLWRAAVAVVILTAAACASAPPPPPGPGPQTVSGQGGRGKIVLIEGKDGEVVLRHDGTVVRRQGGQGGFAAAVFLAGPLDQVEWTGAPPRPLKAAPGEDPVAAAKAALADRPEAWVYLLKADGAVEVLKGPAPPADGEAAATEEE